MKMVKTLTRPWIGTQRSPTGGSPQHEHFHQTSTNVQGGKPQRGQKIYHLTSLGEGVALRWNIFEVLVTCLVEKDFLVQAKRLKQMMYFHSKTSNAKFGCFE